MFLTEANAAAQITKQAGGIPPPPSSRFAGRGIVICAGGIEYLTCAWVLINTLRHQGCTLPIEVFYVGEPERSKRWEALVAPLGVECIDIQAVATNDENVERVPRGWEVKPFAILHSRFEEILFLDADVVPVRNPEFLFETRQYDENGAIFWPDPERFRTTEESPRWGLFGVPFREEPDQESGQLVIHKTRCWQPLVLCNWFNQQSDFFYQYVYGDKDTFRFAWHRLNAPFAMPSKAAGEQVSCTFIQHDFEGEPLFQHRFAAKWSLYRNVKCPGFVFEEACLTLLEQLRSRWDPVSELTGEIGSRDRAAMNKITNARFRSFRAGRRQGRIVFTDQMRIHAYPRGPDEYWWFRDGTLQVATDSGRQIHTLTQLGQGEWRSSSEDGNPPALRFVAA
jgi:hypothetical protein